MTFQDAQQQIQQKLRQYQPRKLTIPGAVPAAVLIPLFNKHDKPHVLLTLRTETVEHHKGQISFPGGAWESQDKSLLQTALRETEEEVGIPQRHFTVLGELDDFLTVTNFLVTPFVAILQYPFEAHPSEYEVAQLLEVPLDIFLTDEYFHMEEREYHNRRFPVYFYDFQGYSIWGATAFIMNRFIELVFDFNPGPYSVLDDPRNDWYLEENRTRRATMASRTSKNQR